MFHDYEKEEGDDDADFENEYNHDMHHDDDAESKSQTFQLAEGPRGSFPSSSETQSHGPWRVSSNSFPARVHQRNDSVIASITELHETRFAVWTTRLWNHFRLTIFTGCTWACEHLKDACLFWRATALPGRTVHLQQTSIWTCNEDLLPQYAQQTSMPAAPLALCPSSQKSKLLPKLPEAV